MRVAALVVVIAAGCSKRPDREPPVNLLLITLDTTRADLLGCYGNDRAQTPTLDRLARDGTRYTRAYTCSPLTLPSHASLLTSTYPTHHGIHYNGTHVLPESAVTLAEVLSGAGFHCGAVMGAYVLHSQFGLDQGFAEYADHFAAGAGGAAERRADAVTDDAIRFLRERGDGPFFLWAHYYDPHEPYAPPPPYDAAYRGREYEGELAFMDAQIGRLLAALEETGEGDRTLIVAVADHGESLMHLEGRQGHGMFIYEETMRIPLIMHHPGSVPEGTVVDDVVGIVDVMPAVLERLGVPAPEGVQGTPLSAGGRPLYLETYGPRAVFGWSELLGVVRGDLKYIHAPQPELYDLAADPREKTNLMGRRDDDAAALHAELDRLLAETAAGGTAQAAALSEAARRRLESLGYTGGVVETDRPDPKAMTDVAAAHARAERLAATNPGSALSAFERIIARHPDDAAAHAEAGKILMGQGSFDRAIAHFERVVELRADAVQTLRLLAYCRFQAGRHEEALAAVDRSLAVNPRSNQGLFVRSLILDALGRRGEAIADAAGALDSDPAYDAARLHLGRMLSAAGRTGEALGQLEAIPPESSARFAARQVMAGIYAAAGRTAQLQAVQAELSRLAAAGAPRTPVIAIAGGGY